MKLAQPEFLYALGVLIIPILIHFFSFRQYKTLQFSQLHFLKEIKKEKQKVSRLKDLLILCSRLLFLAFLVLAFCKPYFPANKVLGGNLKFALFVDNSLSMELEGSAGNNLNAAKKLALQWVNALPNDAQICVLTQNNRTGQNRYLSTSDAIQEINQIQISNSSFSITKRLKRLNSLKTSPEGGIFVISDLQKNQLLEEHIASLPTNTQLLQVKPQQTNNISIDTAWMKSPISINGQQIQYQYQVTNHSNEKVTIPVKLLVNNQLKTANTITLQPFEKQENTLEFLNDKDNWVKVELGIEDAPMRFDNIWFGNYYSSTQINVVEIKGEKATKAFSLLLNKDPEYNLKSYTANNINFEEAGKPSALILNGIREISSALLSLIDQKLEAGSAILIFPPKDIDAVSYQSAFPKINSTWQVKKDSILGRVKKIQLQNTFYNGVFERIPNNLDLPKSTSFFELPSTTTSESLLSFDQNAAIAWIKRANGHLLVSAFTTDSKASNFYNHGLFVPIVLRALESAKAGYSLNAISEQILPINITGLNTQGEPPLSIVDESSQQAWIPTINQNGLQKSMTIQNLSLLSANYPIKKQDSTIAWISINAPRQESQTTFWELNDLNPILKSANLNTADTWSPNNTELAETLSANWFGQDIWHWFAAIALLFLFIEIFLIRILS